MEKEKKMEKSDKIEKNKTLSTKGSRTFYFRMVPGTFRAVEKFRKSQAIPPAMVNVLDFLIRKGLESVNSSK